jgi:hypothetical protein
MQMRKKPQKKLENYLRIQLGNHQRLSATMLLKSLYPTLLAYIIFMLNLGDAAVESWTTPPKDFNSIPVCLFNCKYVYFIFSNFYIPITKNMHIMSVYLPLNSHTFFEARALMNVRRTHTFLPILYAPFLTNCLFKSYYS